MLGKWDLHSIAAVTGAKFSGPATPVSGIVTDSRKMMGGALFVALKGERFDGHEFAGIATTNGAVAVLSSLAENVLRDEAKLEAEVPVLEVEDTLVALGKLGRANRARFKGPVAAVTGSTGKTTVKELLASILETGGPVARSKGNFNNEIGVPLSLLELKSHHVAGVFELGASAVGEIARTTRMTLPDVAVLNNASAAHVEGFGSIENIVKAKAEIFEGLRASGTAILNRDDRNFDAWFEFCKALPQRPAIISFGLSGSADVTATDIEAGSNGSSFRLVSRVPGKSTDQPPLVVDLKLPGRHNVSNALAAAAAAIAFGLEPAAIVRGLSDAQPVAGRLEFAAITDQVTVIDDTYNANPASMAAALGVLRNAVTSSDPAAVQPARIAVLGHMAELGADAAKSHADIGALAGSLDLTSLFGVGTHSEAMCAGYNAARADNASSVNGATAFNDKSAALEALLAEIDALVEAGRTIVVLFKGSRSAGMETIVQAVRQHLTATRLEELR